jgi:NADH-quinone oxidoreductase subunit N
VAGLTILYGNLGALGQTSVKRLYGYSSIAHAGYLLMGLCAQNQLGAAAVLFYLAQYAVTNLCGFLALTAAMNVTGSDDLRALAGLHRRSPLLATGLAVSALSLAGIPPFSGFFGKFALFTAAVKCAQTTPAFYGLVAVGVLGAAVSLYYYFRIVRAVLAEPPPAETPIPTGFMLRAALRVSIVLVIVLGIWPIPIVEPALHVFATWSLP